MPILARRPTRNPSKRSSCNRGARDVHLRIDGVCRFDRRIVASLRTRDLCARIAVALGAARTKPAAPQKRGSTLVGRSQRDRVDSRRQIASARRYPVVNGRRFNSYAGSVSSYPVSFLRFDPSSLVLFGKSHPFLTGRRGTRARAEKLRIIANPPLFRAVPRERVARRVIPTAHRTEDDVLRLVRALGRVGSGAENRIREIR